MTYQELPGLEANFSPSKPKNCNSHTPLGQGQVVNHYTLSNQVLEVRQAPPPQTLGWDRICVAFGNKYHKMQVFIKIYCEFQIFFIENFFFTIKFGRYKSSRSPREFLTLISFLVLDFEFESISFETSCI